MRIALRLFSVCPNSASCERLFSLLKRILTPARSRLTSGNLLNIAELHAHLRQAQVRSGEAVQRLKRCLNPTAQTLQSLSGPAGSSRAGEKSIPTPSLPTSIPSTSARPSPAPPAESPTRETINISLDSDSESDSEQSSTTRIDDPEHIDDLDAEIIASGYNPDITLGDMVDSLLKSVDEDKSLPEPGLSLGKYEVITEENIAVYTGNGLPFRFDIEVLFNFSDSYWVTELESQAESGLGDEVELCELLSQPGADSTMYTDV